MVRVELKQIPEIAIEVFEDGDHSIGLLFGFPDEVDAFGDHLVVIPPEVIGAQEEEDPAAGLTADEGFLFRFGCPGEEQGGATGAGGRDHHPALVLLGLVGVLDEGEMKFVGIKVDGFVVIPDDQGDVEDGLFHHLPREGSVLPRQSKYFTAKIGRTRRKRRKKRYKLYLFLCDTLWT